MQAQYLCWLAKVVRGYSRLVEQRPNSRLAAAVCMSLLLKCAMHILLLKAAPFVYHSHDIVSFFPFRFSDTIRYRRVTLPLSLMHYFNSPVACSMCANQLTGFGSKLHQSREYGIQKSALQTPGMSEKILNSIR